jgi:hypothetical protein
MPPVRRRARKVNSPERPLGSKCFMAVPVT